MRITQVKISNFRGYKDETTIDFNDLMVFVGKNDVGKSTVLEALDVFFNEGKGVIKLDKEDINKQGLAGGNKDICIAVVFEDLPLSLVIDSTNQTTLKDEYLLNSDGKLEIVKTYPNAGKEKVSVKAHHPSNPSCADLLLKKQKELQKIIKDNSISCADEKKNAVMRKSIWRHYATDLQLGEVEIDVTKEDAKNIWDQLKRYMPLYSLFQSDRKNSDGDSEIQDPMKLAVQEILKDTSIQSSLNQIATEVDSKLKEVADRTLEKLKEMNPEIANSLNPVIPSAESLKWADVFKNVSISGDEDIPINKRGSGVKRLVLINFFRAEAERRKAEKNVPDIIYAIEEPETSQHPDHQKKLIDAFLELSKNQHTRKIQTRNYVIAEEVKKQAISDYLAGDNISIKDVAKKHGIGASIVSKTLKENSINIDHGANRKIPLSCHKIICERYLRGDKVCDIAKDFKCRTNTVERIMAENGIARDRIKTKKVNVKRLCRDYDNGNGMSINSLSKKYGASVARVTLMLLKEGQNVPFKVRKLSDKQCEEVVSLYKSKTLNISQIARKYGVTLFIVKKLIAKEGIAVWS